MGAGIHIEFATMGVVRIRKENPLPVYRLSEVRIVRRKDQLGKAYGSYLLARLASK